MERLNPATDIKEYSLNGKKIMFNPGDPDWVFRVFSIIDNVEKRNAVTEEQRKKMDANPLAAFQVARDQDKVIREEIDAVFGVGAADAIYNGNLITRADGLPIWINFLLMIADKIYENMDEQEGKANPRIKEYEAKFARYQKK